MADQKTDQEALRDAIRLLGNRAHSRSELAAKLSRKGVDTLTAQRVLDHLAASGLLDDRAFAKQYVESMTRRKPESKAMLRSRLLQKGVAADAVAAALEHYDAGSSCLQAAEKKMRSLSGTHEVKRKKLETFLRNRGFDWQTIRETICRLDLPEPESPEQEACD